MITCDNMNYSTKFCAIIVIILILINGIYCQACSSPDISPTEFEFGILNPNLIQADHRGTIIEYSMASTTGISSSSNTNMDNLYINAEFNITTNILRIFTTSEFENYEYEQTSTVIVLNLLLTCSTNTRALVFEQRIADANNHSPEFLLPLFEFEIMLPLPTGFDLTWFQEISARDVDLRNNNITFSSTNSGDYITVGTSERIGSDSKTFYATLILTQQLLTIEGNALEFTIIGTDRGTPPRQGQTTVRITSNPTATYIPQPQFEHPLYQGIINNELRLELEQIVILQETFSQEIGFGFDGGDKDLFNLSNLENIITITLVNDPLTEAMLEGRTQLFTTLVAQRASSVHSGSTVILIELPPKLPPIIPRFLKSSYRGTLSEDRTLLSLTENILIDETTFTDDVTLSLEGDDSELFNVIRNGNTILVNLSRELTTNDLNEKIVLICTIIAEQTNTNGTTTNNATTTLIIDIPPLPEIISPTFEKSLYRGLINENRLLTIENVILNITTFTDDVVFILEGDDSEFITITSIDNNMISLNISSDITETDLSDKSILLAAIVAYRNGSANGINGTTHLIIDIAKIELPLPVLMPQFDQLLYLGKIDEDKLLTHNEITFNVSSFPDDIEFTLEGDHELFTLSFNENMITINLTNPLTENDLFDISWFVLSIIATRQNTNNNNNTENINDISNAILLIEVIQYIDPDISLQPTFENHIYRGILNSNLTLIMDNDIILFPNTFTENVTIQLEGDDSDLFSLTRVNNIVSLNLSRELTIEEVMNKSILITTIVARQQGSSINGSTSILIEFPFKDEINLPPIFNELIYRGVIDGNRSLILSDIILNPDSFNNDIRFSIQGDDGELFEISNIENIVSINLAEPLSEIDIFGKGVIVLTINAFIDNQSIGSTVLIIEITPLEESENPIEPQFEHFIYRGLIDTNRSLIINETITLLFDTYSEDNIIFRLEGDDSELFSIINNENIISINLSRELTDEDLTNKLFLMTTIIATNVQSLRNGSTLLIFEIQTNDNDSLTLPIFENIIYKGELNENRSLILDSIILEAEFWTDDVVFSLEGDDSQLFSLANDNNIITMTLLRPLTNDDLLEKSYLLLNIVATSPFYMRNAVTTIIIDIPSIEFDFNTLPTFDQLIYYGNLSTTNSSYDHFEIDRIILTNNEINDDFEILLVGEDNELFIATNVENVITISLARELNEIDLDGKTNFIISIIAIKTNAIANGTATIVINILRPDEPIILLPTFERSVYNGGINENGILTFNQTILLIEETYFADEIEFELVGGDASLFRVSNNLNTITISLVRELIESDLEGKIFLMTELFANRQSIGSNSTILIIDLPEKLPETIPKFERPTYRGSIDENRALSFDEQIQIIDTTYTPDITFALEGGDSFLFNVVPTDNIVIIQLARPLVDEDLDGRSYFMTVLTAKRPIESGGTAGNDNTVLLVNIPVTTERPPIAVPTFIKPMFRGEINDQHEFTIETISLIENTYSTAVNFNLEGGDSSYFSIIRNDEHLIVIGLQSPINEMEELLDKEFLTFDIVARHAEAGLNRASILISLPEKICPVDYTPEFENKNYHFWLKNDFIGIVGTVRAAVTLNDSAVIEYQFISTNDYLNQRIIVNQQLGSITLSQTLLPNEYNFEIIATSNGLLTSTANVQLTVDELIVCPEPEINGTSFVEHSLLVKYISENIIEDLMPSTIGDCTFIIQRITPSTTEEYIRIVPETNMITAFNLNREDSIFDNMDVPQIQITLRLICDPDELNAIEQDEQLILTNNNTTDILALNNSRTIIPISQSARYIDPVTEDGRFYVLTNSIPYSAYTTILTVIIQDENDNEPVFLQPIVSEMLFGYPNPEVAEQLMPLYVMQAIALDYDAGINAQIQYSLSNTQNFQIHGTTGIITPIRDALKLIAEETITITATDRNGAPDGHRTDTLIRVRRLDQSYITIVTIQEEELDDLNHILDEIYDDVGLYLRCLHSAIISLAGNTEILNNNNNFISSSRKSISNSRIAGQTNALRMFVYAIDENDQFIDTNTVQERLSTLSYNIYNLSSVSYEKSSYIVPKPTESNDETNGQMELILIIVAAVLGGLLLLLGLGTFLMWWYKIRPYEYQEMEEDGSVSSQQQVLRSKSISGYDNQKQETSPVMKVNRFDIEQRDSMKINGTTDKESNDNDEQNSKFARSLNDLLDENTNGTVNNNNNNYGGTIAVNQSVNFNGRLASAAAAASAKPAPTVTTPPEPRKSGVRFNEMVERIDIEVEPADISRNDDEDNVNNNKS